MPDENKNASAATDAGKAGQDSGDAHSQPFQVPDRLKGKSVEELAKSYVELEKKLGDQSVEVSDARKKVEDTLELGKQWSKDRQTLQELTELIYSDPERVKAVEGWYASKTGKPDSQASSGQMPKPDNSQPSSQTPSGDTDTRRALQDQIFNDFYAKHGISRLPTKEKKAILERISLQFAELFDPSGKKTISQIVNERSLSTLGRDLENTFRLTDFSGDENLQSALAQEQNNQAAIGGLVGHTVKEDQDKLNASEEQMAKNLGISPEKYLEQKKKIAKERGSVS